MRMSSTTEAAFTALLSEERGGVKLPASVVKHLVKYYLETAELSDVKEFRMDHLVKDVNEAWMDQKGESLPSMHADTAAAWALGKWPAAAKTTVVSPRPAVEAGAPASEKPAALEDEDMALFGSSGPTARETAQLKADKQAQGLSGVEIAVLALALELGSIPPAGDVIGQFRYGSEPRLFKLAKDQRKAGMATLGTIIADDDFDRLMSTHLTGLIREYSARGEVTQASLITSWWSETQAVAPTAKMKAEYVSEYMKRYGGRGLPTPVDILIATRVSSGLGSGAASAESLKETKDSAKAARAEIKELRSEFKSEVQGLKAEVNRLRQLLNNQVSSGAGAGKGGDLKNTICYKCGQKGHRAKDCPNSAKDEDKKAGEEGE